MRNNSIVQHMAITMIRHWFGLPLRNGITGLTRISHRGLPSWWNSQPLSRRR